MVTCKEPSWAVGLGHAQTWWDRSTWWAAVGLWLQYRASAVYTVSPLAEVERRGTGRQKLAPLQRIGRCGVVQWQ